MSNASGEEVYVGMHGVKTMSGFCDMPVSKLRGHVISFFREESDEFYVGRVVDIEEGILKVQTADGLKEFSGNLSRKTLRPDEARYYGMQPSYFLLDIPYILTLVREDELRSSQRELNIERRRHAARIKRYNTLAAFLEAGI
jgi:hypothetical protein